jgi:hypothetical protein
VRLRELVTKVLINPIIRTRTRYFRHAYHPTRDNILCCVRALYNFHSSSSVSKALMTPDNTLSLEILTTISLCHCPHMALTIRLLNCNSGELLVQYDHQTREGPSSSQRGCYIRTITASVQLKNKITGRESHGAWW